MLSIFEENSKLSWFTTVLIGIGIFIISSIPSSGSGNGSNIPYLSTMYHFFAFFFFAFFLMISIIKGKNTKFFIPVIVLSIIYAILDELHQCFISGRFCSFGDVYTDSAGILSAFLLYYFLIRLRS